MLECNHTVRKRRHNQSLDVSLRGDETIKILQLVGGKGDAKAELPITTVYKDSLDA